MTLEPIPDGLCTRASGMWAEEKLDYFRRYLDIFLTSMRHKNWRAINFIDLFSGPGKCIVKDSRKIFLGSPLLSLSHKYTFDHYYFCDADKKALDALKIRCERSGLQNLSINYFCGDGNKLVKNIVREIQDLDKQFIRNKWPSLNIAFLDPEGLELEWSTIAELAKVNRMDLIIHFSLMGIKREMPNEINLSQPTKLDLFFGGTEWREIYLINKNSRNLGNLMLSLYRQKLNGTGYLDLKEAEPLMRNKARNAPLYRLIFASKHKVANEFWQKVIQRDVYGQSRLL